MTIVGELVGMGDSYPLLGLSAEHSGYVVCNMPKYFGKHLVVIYFIFTSEAFGHVKAF